MTSKKVSLDKEIKTKFFTAHALTPGFDEERSDCYRKRLKRGEKVAVFILKDHNGTIKTLGLSKVMRLPMKNNIESIVSNQQKMYKDIRYDLSEMIFGSIRDGKDQSLKGRVQISHGWCEELIDDNSLSKKVEGILGAPKPSFYPLYLEQKQGANNYKTYDNDNVRIAGRKLYKVHKIPTDLPRT